MTVNLVLFLYVYYKNVQLHVLILCTPLPTLCDVLLCHVTCPHPPKAWDSHHVVVVVGCCRCVSGSFSCFSFSGKQFMISSGLYFYFIFFVTIPSGIASETVFRECYPPSQLFPKPHALHSLHGHTHAKNPKKCIPTRPPHTRPQPSILYIFRNPTSHSSKSHTPTNPSQFLQIPTGLTEPSKAARIHPHIVCSRTHTVSATLSL